MIYALGVVWGSYVCNNMLSDFRMVRHAPSCFLAIEKLQALAVFGGSSVLRSNTSVNPLIEAVSEVMPTLASLRIVSADRVPKTGITDRT
eukprot:5304676-Amphidinium_carterae.1